MNVLEAKTHIYNVWLLVHSHLRTTVYMRILELYKRGCIFLLYEPKIDAVATKKP